VHPEWASDISVEHVGRPGRLVQQCRARSKWVAVALAGDARLAERGLGWRHSSDKLGDIVEVVVPEATVPEKELGKTSTASRRVVATVKLVDGVATVEH